MHTRIQKIKQYAPSPFQGRLEFASASVSKPRLSLTIEHPLERVAFKILVVGLIALSLAYLYFVASSILNVMAQRSAMAQTTLVEGAIAGLEQQYFALSQSITPASGAPLGFSPVAQVNYVYRPGNVGIATVPNDEI